MVKCVVEGFWICLSIIIIIIISALCVALETAFFGLPQGQEQQQLQLRLDILTSFV